MNKLKWLFDKLEGLFLIFIAVFISGFFLFNLGLISLSLRISTTHEKLTSIAGLIGMLVLVILCFGGGLRIIKTKK